MKEFYLKNKKIINEYLLMTLGIAIGGFSFSFFLNPNNVVVGGVSGIGVILKNFFNIDPAIIILIINITLLLFSLLFLGKDFFIKTIYGSVMFPVFIFIFDEIYKFINTKTDNFDFTKLNPLLVIVFSAIIMGFGLGLSIKHGGSTGGVEIPQKVLFKYCHIPFSISLYFIDGSIILLGYLSLNQSIETLLYEIIFLVLNGFILDTVIFSGFNKRALYIISDKVEEIRSVILKELDRGLSSVDVIGEYSGSNKKMLICVLSSSEYYKLRNKVEEIDPKAFFFAVRAHEVRGEGFSYEQIN